MEFVTTCCYITIGRDDRVYLRILTIEATNGKPDLKCSTKPPDALFLVSEAKTIISSFHKAAVCPINHYRRVTFLVCVRVQYPKMTIKHFKMFINDIIKFAGNTIIGESQPSVDWVNISCLHAKLW